MPNQYPDQRTIHAEPLQEGSSFRIPFQSLRVISALLMREMTTTYGRSKLGYLWAILEPVGGIVVLTLGFSILFREPPVGSSFALFYATGFLPFSCYTYAYSQTATALKGNKALLFYPAVTFMDVILARLLLVSLTQVVIAIVVFSGIILYEETGSRVDILYILASIFGAIGIGTGVGLLNATLFEIMPSWQRVWAILNRPVFFLSGVFYSFEDMPENVQTLIWWNPLVHVIGQMRTGFYSEYRGDYISMAYVAAILMTLSAIGLLNMRVANRYIINN